MDLLLTWSDFKVFVGRRKSDIFLRDMVNYFELYAYEGPLVFMTTISNDVVDDEYIDFNTNYRSLCNPVKA